MFKVPGLKSGCQQGFVASGCSLVSSVFWRLLAFLGLWTPCPILQGQHLRIFVCSVFTSPSALLCVSVETRFASFI